MVTPGNREGEKERDREAEKEERIFCYARREKKISGGAMYECVFALAVRSIAKNRSQPWRSLHKPGTKRTRKREEEKKRGVVRRKMAMKGRRWWLVITRKNEIYRSSVHRRSDYPRRNCYLRRRLSPEGETLSLEQAARPTGEKKKKYFGCSPWMTSGGDFSTRIPLFSPRNNRLVLARPTR